MATQADPNAKGDDKKGEHSIDRFFLKKLFGVKNEGSTWLSAACVGYGVMDSHVQYCVVLECTRRMRHNFLSKVWFFSLFLSFQAIF